MCDPLLQWYYPLVGKTQAVLMLRCQPSGTFLLRSSSDPTAKYTLSVVVDRQVVFIRIFEDADGLLYVTNSGKQRRFSGIVELIRHYLGVQLTSGLKGGVQKRLRFRLTSPLINQAVPTTAKSPKLRSIWNLRGHFRTERNQYEGQLKLPPLRTGNTDNWASKLIEL